MVYSGVAKLQKGAREPGNNYGKIWHSEVKWDLNPFPQ